MCWLEICVIEKMKVTGNLFSFFQLLECYDISYMRWLELKSTLANSRSRLYKCVQLNKIMPPDNIIFVNFYRINIAHIYLLLVMAWLFFTLVVVAMI